MQIKSRYKFLLVGTISNAEDVFERDFKRVFNSLNKLGDVDVFLVESDSQDKTVNLLASLERLHKGFKYKSLGKLETSISNRVERIRLCRNYYVEYIRQNNGSHNWDYVVVADLDGMNSQITSRKIARSLSTSSRWDACFATQTFGYYDLYALRAKNWVEKDVFEELEQLKRRHPFHKKSRFQSLNFLYAYWHFDKLRAEAIYSKMRHLTSGLIDVDSAFGGFAIYKSFVFQTFDYLPENVGVPYKCEHLDLHSKCKKSGLSLVIDSGLTNSYVNEYNLNRIKAIRFLREFKKYYFNRP